MASMALAFDILARDKASRELDNVGNAAERAGGKLGGMGGMAKAAFAAFGTAAVAGAAKSLTAFVGFEQKMNEVFTLLPGISSDAMDSMTGQVKDFSKEFGVLPDEVVPALYQSLSAGVPQDNVFEFLETAQKAAKGGVAELTTAVDGISSVVNAYGADVIDATKASDLMFTAVRLGKTNFNELSSSLSNVTPIASALGVQFGDVTAALATMTSKGTPTAVATTQLRQLFVELSKAGGAAATTFEEMAGKSFQQFIAEGGNTADALALMQKAADDSGVALQDMFGSVEAGAAALSLAGGDTFTSNIDAMGASAGATEKAFQQMNRGLGPIFDRLRAHLSVFMLNVGEKLADAIHVGIDAFNGLVAFLSSNTPVLAAVGTTLATVLVPAVWASVTAIYAKAAAWAAAAAAMVVANAPVIAIAAAVGALTAGVVWAYQNVDIFRNAVDTVARFLTGTLIPAVGGVISWFGEMGAKAGELAATVATKVDDIVGFFTRLPDRISRAASGAFRGLVTALQGVLVDIAKAWNRIDLEFTIPDVIGVPGRGETYDLIPDVPVPKFHAGGRFRAPLGEREGLAMLLDGERVLDPVETLAYERGAGQGDVHHHYNFTVPAGVVRSERDIRRELDSARFLTGKR